MININLTRNTAERSSACVGCKKTFQTTTWLMIDTAYFNMCDKCFLIFKQEMHRVLRENVLTVVGDKKYMLLMLETIAGHGDTGELIKAGLSYYQIGNLLTKAVDGGLVVYAEGEETILTEAGKIMLSIL